MRCRICDSGHLEPVLDLGMQPWCNHFLEKEEVGTEPLYPLRLVFCLDCRVSQLDYTVPKEILFGDHTYLSGTTKTLDDHFAEVAAQVDERFFGDREAKSVLDIGSNDGTQLKHFKRRGYVTLGVESSERTARIANENGIETIHAFFNGDLAQQLGRKFEVVNAAGVFFHLEELHSVTDGIRTVLAEDGVFVVQFLYMKSIIENVAFDQIYHEHLLYYTVETIQTILGRHGLELFDARLAPIHGGSVIGYAGAKGRRPVSERLQALIREETSRQVNELSTYRRFAREVEKKRERDRTFLHSVKESGRRVFGLGAPAKGNTLLNYFEIGPDVVEFLVERNELRKGLYSPGMHIPIILEEEMKDVPDVFYVLAWNFRTEILRRYHPWIEKGVEMYFPVEPVE